MIKVTQVTQVTQVTKQKKLLHKEIQLLLIKVYSLQFSEIKGALYCILLGNPISKLVE